MRTGASRCPRSRELSARGGLRALTWWYILLRSLGYGDCALQTVDVEGAMCSVDVGFGGFNVNKLPHQTHDLFPQLEKELSVPRHLLGARTSSCSSPKSTAQLGVNFPFLHSHPSTL